MTSSDTESTFLAAMAYDRSVAICRPLQYPVLMRVKVCVGLVTGSWLGGLVNSVTHMVLATTLTLCGPQQISHFLCDVPLLLKLSCSDTSVNESVLHVASATIGLSPCSSLQAPTHSSWWPSSGFPLPRAGGRPSPPVRPTSLWWCSSREQPASTTTGPERATPWTRTSWSLCSSVW